MRKLTRRETVLICILLVVAVWAAAINWLILPLYYDIQTQKRDAVTLKGDYTAVSIMSRQGADSEQRLNEQVETAKSENYFYKNLSAPQIDKLLQKQTASAQLTINSISISEGIDLSMTEREKPAAEATDDTNATDATDDTPATDAAASAADLIAALIGVGKLPETDVSAISTISGDFFSRSVLLSVGGSLENAAKLLDSIKSLNKSVVIEGIRGTENTDKENQATNMWDIQLTFYYLQ